MTSQAKIDCIVVGYNEIDFQDFARRQREMSSYSGAFQEVKTNSILLGGERITYMDLLNDTLEGTLGHNPQLSGFGAPNLSVFLLADLMRRRGLHAERINHFNQGRDELRAMLETGPRSVAITTTYYVEGTPIREIVDFVREHSPETKVIVGGPHIYNVCGDFDSGTQNLVLQSMGADFYIHDSQGELTLTQLVAQLRDGDPVDRIPNLVYTEDGSTFLRTARVPESNDLADLRVDWTHYDPRDIGPTNYMRTARSCPFACAFCNYPTLAGPHVTADLDMLEAEMRVLHERGVRHLIFVDDTFNVPANRFKEICRIMIRNRFDFRWVSFFRCSNADEESFDLAAESGCMGVLLGIESGDQRILNNMNKAVKLDRYRKGIRRLKERGIITYSLLFFGYPGENEESVRNTIDFVRETQPDYFLSQLYFHDIKAPIHKRSEEFGIKGAGYSWRHDTMTWQEAAQWVEHSYHEITDSTILPLYGIGLWTLPYLLDKGLTRDHFSRFTGEAHKMLVASLDDKPVDFAPQQARLREMFQGVRLNP